MIYIKISTAFNMCFSMAFHALLAIKVATWKSPPSLATIIWMHVEQCCIQRQAVTKNLSHKSKKNHRKSWRSHRRQHVEKMWWWERADQQVSCVIFFNNILFRWWVQYQCKNCTDSKANNMKGNNNVLPMIIIIINIIVVIIIIPLGFLCVWLFMSELAD